MALSPSNFEHTALTLIWQVSLALAIASICIMFALILRKLWQNRTQKKTQKRFAELSRIIYKMLINPSLSPTMIRHQISAFDKPLICKIALNILRNVRGQAETVLVATLMELNMYTYLHSLLKSGTRGKRIQALKLLSHYRNAESLNLLLAHVDEKDPYVQLAALHGLAENNAIQYLSEIIKILKHPRSHHARLLGRVLQKFGEPAIPALIELSEEQAADTDARVAAIDALAEIGSLQVVDTMLSLTNDSNFNIRAHAIAALAKLNDIRANPIVLTHLNDKEAAVRIQAAKAAGSLQLQAAVPQLIQLLSDQNWWARYRAAEALYRLGNRGLMILRAHVGQNNQAADIAEQFLAEKENQVV